MSKRFLIILAVLFVGFIGIVVFSRGDDSANQNGDTAGGSNHVQGANTEGVTLVEYGDFQCPACRSYFPVLQQVKDKYGDQIAFQFKHFPLVQIHQNAMVAHRAAEAAGQQGKFWEMHDLLYQRQNAWAESSNPTSIMEDYAAELGINVDQFKEAFSSELVNDIIQADIRDGQALGITSTPSFAINGQKIDNPPNDLEGFSQLIDEQIAEQGQQ